MSKNEKREYIKPSIELLKDGENSLKSFIQSERFLEKTDGIDICLGVTEDGEKYIVDLTKLSNLLIVGWSGMGKTVLINSLITGLLYKYSPEELQLAIFDLYGCGYKCYKNLPHMLFSKSIEDYSETMEGLKKLIDEMNRRRKILEDCSNENIIEYNKNLEKKEALPRIIIIVDELANFMWHSKGSLDFIMSLVALSLFGRKVGIHVIATTQRPADEIVTGLIENRFFARIAFRLDHEVASMRFLGIAGAEKLIKYGDMFFLSSDMKEPIKLKGIYSDHLERKDICDFIRENNC